MCIYMALKKMAVFCNDCNKLFCIDRLISWSDQLMRLVYSGIVEVPLSGKTAQNGYNCSTCSTDFRKNCT